MRSNLNFPQASVSDVRLNLNFTQTRLGFHSSFVYRQVIYFNSSFDVGKLLPF